MIELTTRQVAQVLGVSESTVKRMVRQGRLLPMSRAPAPIGYRFDPDKIRPEKGASRVAERSPQGG